MGSKRKKQEKTTIPAWEILPEEPDLEESWKKNRNDDEKYDRFTWEDAIKYYKTVKSMLKNEPLSKAELNDIKIIIDEMNERVEHDRKREIPVNPSVIGLMSMAAHDLVRSGFPELLDTPPAPGAKKTASKLSNATLK